MTDQLHIRGTNESKTVITCALTGVLTNPAVHHVPVTPEEMAEQTQQAYDAGASTVHVHFRNQGPGLGHLPTWDLETVGDILAAIKARVPDIIICMSTGVVGPDISAPAACLEKFKPEMAACNAGSLNYLKLKSDGNWAWPPTLFDNPVDKVERFLTVMKANGVVPEFECFDSGIVRSVGLYQRNGMFEGPAHISLVMGVASGMPAKPEWLPLLIEGDAPGRPLAGDRRRPAGGLAAPPPVRGTGRKRSDRPGRYLLPAQRGKGPPQRGVDRGPGPGGPGGGEGDRRPG